MTAPAGIIATHYRVARRDGVGAGLLIVNLSERPRFWLGSVEMPHPTIDLADCDTGYFVTELAPLRAAIKAIVETDSGVTQVCFLGMSKSGYAALHLSRALAGADPARRYSAIAFSPQARVWPDNPAISFPSYHRMIERAAGEPSLRAELEAVGDQTVPMKQRNLRWLIVYPEFNARDAAEALAISGARIRHEPLPMRYHTTILPYLCDIADEASVRRTVAAVVRNAAAEPDLQDDPMTASEERIVAELRRMVPRPGLAQLINWFTGVPSATPALRISKPWWRTLSTRAWRR